MFLFLLFSFNSYSKVIYFDINPDVTLQGSEQQPHELYQIDFNNDSLVEALIVHFYIPGIACYGEMSLNQDGYSDMITDVNNFPKALDSGTVIDSNSQIWYQPFPPSISLIMTQNWRGMNDRFLGIRFKKNNQYYYGWVRLTYPSDEKCVIVKEYAFEDIPHKGINAGEFNLFEPDISLSLTSIDFGKLILGNIKDTSITITNSGNAKLIIDNIDLKGNDSADFILSEDKSGFSLDPGLSKQIKITFKPAAIGSKTALVSFVNSHGITAAIDLKGNCGNQPEPALIISTQNVAFGDTDVGCSKDTSISVSNTGTADLLIENVVISGVNELEFIILTDLSYTTLIPSESKQLIIRFAPIDKGAGKTSSINFISNSKINPSITLTGNGKEPVSVEDNTESAKITIYPNPAQNFISLKIENHTNIYEHNVEIYSITGEKLILCNYTEIIDIGSFPIGLYFVKYNNFITHFIKNSFE